MNWFTSKSCSLDSSVCHVEKIEGMLKETILGGMITNVVMKESSLSV